MSNYQKNNPIFEPVKKAINSNRELFFGKDFGFSEPTFDEFYDYIHQDSEFGFKLKRKKGAGILYGVCHAKARRLLNILPAAVRRSIVMQKLYALGIWSDVMTYCSVSEDSHECVDAQDIGMGDSIFLVVFEKRTPTQLTAKLDGKPEKQYVVIKRDGTPLQSMYGQFLDAMGVPFVSNQYLSKNGKDWEFAEWTGPKNLSESLTPQNLDMYIEDLGMHAAIGDILGRGDRHLENYGLKGGRVVPFDVSFLFCKDNAIWTKKYVQSGMYEYSTLVLADAESRYSSAALFKKGYQKGKHLLLNHKSLIRAFVKEVCQLDQKKINPEDAKEAAIVARISRRLDDPSYVEGQLSFYGDCFAELQHRQTLKHRLQVVAKTKLAQLKKYNWLYMYYLADKDRLSSFYLMENCPENLRIQLDTIEKG